jgi:heterogeneous nuclear rnp K-like protein 2
MSNDAVDTHESHIGADENAAFDSAFQNLTVNDEHGEDGEHEGARTEEEYAIAPLTLRAIVSSKEAGVIIGKAGKNVADLRDETGVKAGVSKVVPGVHDRVLTVTGSLDGIARAYSIVTQTLLDNPPSTMTAVPPGQHRMFLPARSWSYVANNALIAVRLLISHNQMGTIIGRQGLKIKHIQDVSGARMVAQKEMLPQSTERVVEVQGDANAIRMAVWEIGKCLIDDWQRGTGTVLYNPAVRAQGGSGTVGSSNGGMGSYGGNDRGERGATRSYARTGNGADFSDATPSFRRNDAPPPMRSTERQASVDAPVAEDGEDFQTQCISIPADMVGCIIGRGGTKIQEIRRTSGARISIAKAPHDDTGERMFTITGTNTSNEKALYLLYENLEAEKLRRNSQGSPE